MPDPVGDLLFNGVASDVFRSSFLNGISDDAAYRLNDAHPLRAGFYAQGEQTQIKNLDAVECAASGLAGTVGPQARATAPDSTVVNVPDASNLFGWQLGGYVQDECRPDRTSSHSITACGSTRCSNMSMRTSSARASFTYKPWWSTVFHIGYMRTFTPPPQVLGRAIDSTLFDNTTLSAAIDPVTNLPIRSDPIQPERAHVVDAGVVQQLLPQCPVATSRPTKAPVAAPNCPSLEVGANVYYKAAKDLLDDGQFGQALALTAFNYEKGENYGAEATLRFRSGNFSFDTSWAYGLQHATHIVSNQALFSAEDLAFIQNNWIHTDHDQYISGSARAAYRWTDTHT